MIQLITGKNDYAAWAHLQKIKADFKGEVLDLNANEVELQELKEALASQSLFNLGGDKMVIIREVSASKPTLQFVSSTQDTDTSVVIYDTAFDKRTSLFKSLQKQGKVNEFKEPSEPEIINWVIKKAESLGAVISRPNAALLVRRVGQSQWLLTGEVQKLALFDSSITKEAVEQLTEVSPDETIFNMLDLLSAGKSEKVLKISSDLMEQGSDPIYLNSMLVWHFHNIAIAATTSLQSDGDIAKYYKMSPYVIGKARRSARSLDRNKLKKVFSLINRADFKLKNQSVNRAQVMQILLLELCEISR